MVWVLLWMGLVPMAFSGAPYTFSGAPYTLETQKLLQKAKMIGEDMNWWPAYNGFNNAFDDYRTPDPASLYMSDVATESDPQGVEITFETVTRVHDIIIVPRGFAPKLERSVL